MNENRPILSVIVAGQNAWATAGDCLAALLPQAAAANAEMIFVDGSNDGTADLVATSYPQVKLLRCDAQALVPHLWKAGLDQASGQVVVFTIAQCIPAPNWLAAILAAGPAGEVAGIGGPIDGPAGRRARDWALYFARYSAFLPPGGEAAARPIQDVPGDNAAYQRAALESCQAAMAGGFWETLVHVCLRRQGQTLRWEPAVRVRFGPVDSLARAASIRRRHGQHYAVTRPGNTLGRRLVRILASPLLPPLLLARIAGRVRRQRPEWTPHLLRALPALLFLLLAWTVGEASGYLLGRPPYTPRP
ncbi:MAG: glycosyltransferase [Chloroflexi bacterium]|nr:glycosyltransferase [Chloroflexota bacterium]MCI0579121.1 glycosyltransferase [Chloroflexota bacterium]MCI0643338.1 glycosyltransferase [Chloroflexota bacterium]MCI0728317.1 glycosyltransferase [Chloroflexota bacterium]